MAAKRPFTIARTRQDAIKPVDLTIEFGPDCQPTWENLQIDERHVPARIAHIAPFELIAAFYCFDGECNVNHGHFLKGRDLIEIDRQAGTGWERMNFDWSAIRDADAKSLRTMAMLLVAAIRANSLLHAVERTLREAAAA